MTKEVRVRTPRFPQALCIRAPAGLNAAIEAAARKHCTVPSEWARQALIKALRSEGEFLSTPAATRDPGFDDRVLLKVHPLAAQEGR